MKFTESWKTDSFQLISIAGPCSAESRDQVLDVANAISSMGIAKVMRAGVWKPRTRPGSFEGHGEEALAWLKEAKERFGLLVATEVATPRHVELALAYGIDILWIGARTSAGPFAVQEIADSLRGIDIPIMVKNPLSPDLEAWVGAIERFQNSGQTKVAAIHRGFSCYEKGRYRNPPIWSIPLELRARFPELPLLCDPSHIAGKRDLLEGISKNAIDLGMDGLMVETHPNPQVALSDSAQQITPDALKALLEEVRPLRPHLSRFERNSTQRNSRVS